MSVLLEIQRPVLTALSRPLDALGGPILARSGQDIHYNLLIDE